MSESVSNDGESYSNGGSKYNVSGFSSSESPGGESSSTNPAKLHTAINQEDKINEIKKLLMEAENYLVKFSKDKFLDLDTDIVKNAFRDLVVKNEASILVAPTPNTLVAACESTHAGLYANEKNEPKNKVLMDGLKEFSIHKYQSSSKLKYW